MSDYRWMIEDMLKRAGTLGLKQFHLTSKLQHHAGATEIVEHLEQLRTENKVQRFTIKTKNKISRPTTVWRATNLLE